MKAKHTNNISKRYFNLIEMLVVILVIVVIAALLLGALTRAKAYAMQTSCSNNLHQISVAHQSYKSDHKFFPKPYRWLDDFRPIYPYCLSYNIFKCPAKYPKTVIENTEDLKSKPDYWVCTVNFFKDFELNLPSSIDKKDKDDNNYQGNQGHGNNDMPYDIDPSNPKFVRIAADKMTDPVVYDKYGPAHFDSVNISFIDDTRVETMNDMCFVWTLTPRDTLFLDAVTQWPNPFVPYEPAQ